MVTGIVRVDGDQRDSGQVFAFRRRRFRVAGLFQRVFRELGGDVVRMDRQQAGRSRIGNVADHLHHNTEGWPVLPAADRFRLGDHEIAILRTFPVGFLDHELPLLLAG